MALATLLDSVKAGLIRFPAIMEQRSFGSFLQSYW
jgi:hypothetical protein